MWLCNVREGSRAEVALAPPRPPRRACAGPGASRRAAPGAAGRYAGAGARAPALRAPTLAVSYVYSSLLPYMLVVVRALLMFKVTASLWVSLHNARRRIF